MARDFQRLGRLVGDDLNLGVGVQRIGQVDQTVVDPRGNRGVSKAR
jgi:hypothetical protein